MTSRNERDLAFEKYMQEHPDVAQAYDCLKYHLAEQLGSNSSAYNDGLDSFIRAINHRTKHPRPDQLCAKDNIVIAPYNPNWPKLAAAELATIKECVPLPYVAMEHLGSTSVPGLDAKPLIDIFIAMEAMNDIPAWTAGLKNLGYIDWPENPDKMHERFFKGMPPFGIGRTHHIHILPIGDDFTQRVRFRDLLRQNDALRKSYAKLKIDLASTLSKDREGYRNAKSDFIKKALSST